MSFEKQRTSGAEMDGELEQAIANFSQSVHAWSEAEFSRPRTVAAVEHRRAWRLAAAWGLGCVLAAGSLAGGLYDHHRQELAAAAARLAHQRQMAAEEAAEAQQANEKLFATVDMDVSRSVPSAMEPLAQLMDESSNP